MTRSTQARSRRAFDPVRLGPWGLLGLLGLGGVSCAAPSIDESWADHDPSNAERLDHSDWQALLDAYLITDDPSGVNLVDYSRLKANPADQQRLAGYIDYLRGLDPRQYARDVQMAYWINLYNAVTLRVVLDEYPVESIKDIHEGLIPNTGPWGDVHAMVAGQPLTLDNIEHDILRRIWQDNRIHYGVNCASISCPNLAPEAYTAENLERLLDQGARDYVNHPRGAELLDEAFGVVSSIYYWYHEDFGNSDAGVLEHLRKYAEGDLAEQLRDFDGALDHEYDWNLNAPRTP
ncbi:DUF547 domain-containing protein [Candidatus Palauibacter sp.]|uniref:DUF547 domain-containing protein n=1 Tax=Candidatus Palauibacter sp. TaxID=3101350 RepID=UPI003B5B4670